MTPVDVRTSLPSLEIGQIQLQPSDATAVKVFRGIRRLGHAFFYSDGMEDAINVLESETLVQIGLVHNGDNPDVASLCVVTDEGSRSKTDGPIVLGEGSSHVMRYVLHTMIPGRRIPEMRNTPLKDDVMVHLVCYESLLAACAVVDTLIYIREVRNQASGVVFDVTSPETGQSVGPVLLRDRMMQVLYKGFEETEVETIRIGFGNVRPEDPDEVTMYVFDPSSEEVFRQNPEWGNAEPTGVAVGSPQVIHRLLCNLSPTWGERIGHQDQDLEVVNGGEERQYFMLEIPYDEARQLVERLWEVCQGESEQEVLASL